MCPFGNDHDVPRWLTTRTSPSSFVTTPPALRVFFIHSVYCPRSQQSVRKSPRINKMETLSRPPREKTKSEKKYRRRPVRIKGIYDHRKTEAEYRTS
jgi:hypothetical protein